MNFVGRVLVLILFFSGLLEAQTHFLPLTAGADSDILLGHSFICSGEPQRASETCRHLKPRLNQIKIQDAAYFPQSSRLRKIYGSWWNEVSAEYGRHIHKWIQGFLNGSFVYRTGESLGFDHRTKIWLVPVTVGLNIPIEFSPQIVWLPGIGIGCCYERFRDESPYLAPLRDSWGPAFLFRLAFEWKFSPKAQLLLFSSYRVNWTHFPKPSFPIVAEQASTGGLQLGGGFGFSF